MNLTNDSEKLLCILYRSYLEKRKLGNSKRISKSFGSSHDIHEELCPGWFFDDVDEACWELAHQEFLDCLPADGIAYHVNLSDSAILYMENRFKNGILDIANFLSNFI